MSRGGECSTIMDEAYVSLATNDSYSKGALTLGKSLRDSGTSRRLALMVTSGVSREMRHQLCKVWDELVDIEELDSGDVEHLALLSRPELGVTFSKINAWRLMQYSKCVFLDADTLVLQNVDELFDREELSAAPDIGWPDCFNSGVFVFEPSLQTFHNLVELSRETGSFDGGDQGLLNLYWCDWATKDIKYHLPFTFNVTPNVTYGYVPALQRFGGDIKIIHFIGPIKPWQHRYLPEVDAVILYPGTYAAQNAAQDYIKRWWQVYVSLERLDWNAGNHQGHHHHRSTPHHSDDGHSSPSHHTPSEHVPPPPPPITPNLGDGFVVRNPYQNLHSGYAFSHSVTPLDSASHFKTRRYFLTPPDFRSDIKHLISPLDSVHQLDDEEEPAGEDIEEDVATISGLSSPLSHEDVHSHISLSFYSQNGMFDRISTLVHTEPRSYYVDHRLPDSEQEGELDYVVSTEDFESSGSTWSLSHLDPLPSYRTPPSVLCQPSFPSLFITPYSFFDSNWGYYPGSYSAAASTEHDEMHDGSHDYHMTAPEPPSPPMRAGGGGPLSHDSHVTAPDPPPSEVAEGDATLQSDSVLPVTYPSFPLPPFTTHPPPSQPPHAHIPRASSIKSMEFFRSGSQTSMTTTESQAIGDHRKAFEAGSIDFRGRDSFTNIQAHIEQMLGGGTTSDEPQSEQN